MAAPSPIISPAELAARLDDPVAAGRRRPLGARHPGSRAAAYDEGHIPGAIFLDVDTDLVAPTDRDAIRSPRPPRSGPGSRPPGSAANTGWSPTTTSVAGSLRGCGGCSMTSGHDASAVLDGGFPAWVAAGTAGHPGRPDVRASAARPGRPLDQGRSIAPGSSRVLGRRAARRPWRPALPRRNRADRRSPGPHPDGAPRADRGQPRARRAAPPPADARARGFEGLGADGSDGPVVTSCGSGVAACFNSLAMRRRGSARSHPLPRFVQRLEPQPGCRSPSARSRASRSGRAAPQVSATARSGSRSSRSSTSSRMPGSDPATSGGECNGS